MSAEAEVRRKLKERVSALDPGELARNTLLTLYEIRDLLALSRPTTPAVRVSKTQNLTLYSISPYSRISTAVISNIVDGVEQLLPLVEVATRGYENHKWTTLAFSASPAKAAFVDLPTKADLVLLSPSVAAYLEVDRTIQTDTPSVAAAQSLSATMRAKRIYAQGVSAAGTLSIWAWW